MKRMYPAVFFRPLHFMLLSIISYPLEFVFWDLFWYTKCIGNSEGGFLWVAIMRRAFTIS